MAIMWTVIIKNPGAPDQMVEDLGIVIPGLGQVTMDEQFTFDALAGSDSLRTLVQAGTLVVNDGSSDLSAANGVLYLTFVHRKYLTDNHWTKTQLAATGGANDRVDWSQLQNIPAFGAPEWDEPVLYRAMGIQSAAPVGAQATGDLDSRILITAEQGYAGNLTVEIVDGETGDVATITRSEKTLTVTIDDGTTTEGTIATALAGRDEIDTAVADTPLGVWTLGVGTDTVDLTGGVNAPVTGSVYVDSDDDHYYKYNGATWDDLGAASANDRVINLGNATQNIYAFISSVWTDLGQSDDNTAVMVNDDGDGKAAQYIYETQGLRKDEWLKIGDVDFSGHLDGGPDKHKASEITIEGTYTYISTGDLETGLSDIDTELGDLWTAIGGITGNTLDQAYDQGGAGAGRIINTTDGPLELDRGAATSAELRMVPKGSLPTTSLADGQLTNFAGFTWIYDGTRSKWLSLTRMWLHFGKLGRTQNQYLAFGSGQLYSNNAGYRIFRNATITGIAAQLDVAGTATFAARKNDVTSDIATVALAAATGNHDHALNIDVAAGDFIQAYLSSAAKVEDPVMIVEIAWRG